MSKVAAAKSAIVARIPRACADEAEAVRFMEEQRWGGSPACPRCGDTEVKQMKSKDGTRNARFLWRCYGCKQQFTVKIGTIMEDSPIPVRFWCLAFYRACASKKGVSALQIQRETGLTYKSALFMMHRIRWAMKPANEGPSKLGAGGGTVEFDETYVGGKPRSFVERKKLQNYYSSTFTRKRGPAPDFKDRKTPVVAGVERGGRVRAAVVVNVTRATVPEQLFTMVSGNAHLMTDESKLYERAGAAFASHQTINHTRGEYARGDVTTNSVEGFFAGLKRQIRGTHHQVSRKHLQRYVDEVAFKFNTRHLEDGARTAQAIQSMTNRRLTYKDQVGTAPTPETPFEDHGNA